MRGLALIAAICLMPVSALAQDMKPGRYMISPAMDGYIRIDTTTGGMLYCKNFDSIVRCEDVGVDTTEKRASEAEMDDLRNRIGELERQVAVLERDQVRLPTEKDWNKTLDMMEGFMRRFMDTTKDLDKDTTL